MDRKETKQVLDEIIEESYKKMKENAEAIMNGNWNFDMFGDRNTFARIAFECLAKYELEQYKAQNLSSNGKTLRTAMGYYLIENHK